METDNCSDIFKYPFKAIDVYNALGSQGYTDEDIFSICAHLSFLCYGILKDTDKCKTLTQTAIDVTILLDSFQKAKLC